MTLSGLLDTAENGVELELNVNADAETWEDIAKTEVTKVPPKRAPPPERKQAQNQNQGAGKTDACNGAGGLGGRARDQGRSAGAQRRGSCRTADARGLTFRCVSANAKPAGRAIEHITPTQKLLNKILYLRLLSHGIQIYARIRPE